jgi:hypothetical protein
VHGGVAGGGEQQGDEGGGVAGVGAVEAEQLLELVDQDQQALARGQGLDAEAPVEGAGAAAEVLLQLGDGLGLLAGRWGCRWVGWPAGRRRSQWGGWPVGRWGCRWVGWPV